METWVWLGAYLVGFVLLQVYLYRYFIKRGRSESGTTTAGLSRQRALRADGEQERPGAIGHGDGETRPDPAVPADLDIEDAIRCGECGAYNERDQMFVYCQHCGEKL
jgi:hypothetical protein